MAVRETQKFDIEIDNLFSMAKHRTAKTIVELELVISQLHLVLETMKKKNHEDRHIGRRMLVLSWAFFLVVMLSILLSGSSSDDFLALPQ